MGIVGYALLQSFEPSINFTLEIFGSCLRFFNSGTLMDGEHIIGKSHDSTCQWRGSLPGRPFNIHCYNKRNTVVFRILADFSAILCLCHCLDVNVAHYSHFVELETMQQKNIVFYSRTTIISRTVLQYLAFSYRKTFVFILYILFLWFQTLKSLWSIIHLVWMLIHYNLFVSNIWFQIAFLWLLRLLIADALYSEQTTNLFIYLLVATRDFVRVQLVSAATF